MWNYIAKIADFLPKIMKKMHFRGHAVQKLSNMVRWKHFFASKTKTCYRYGIYLQQVFCFWCKKSFFVDVFARFDTATWGWKWSKVAVSKLANTATQKHFLYQNLNLVEGLYHTYIKFLFLRQKNVFIWPYFKVLTLHDL